MRPRHRDSLNGLVPNGSAGFTLIELMIALLIGLFLLGALMTIVQTNRTVFGDQNKLAQLQDAERMAMTMMSDVIQSAGYFPQPYAPYNNTLVLSLPVAAPFTTPGQSFFGTHSTTLPGDQMSVRYMTANNDGILNCSGQQNTSGGNALYVNTFQVQAGELVCVLNNNGTVTTYNLVGDGATIVVNNLSILYGVKTNAAAAGNSPDTYMDAGQVNASPDQWNSVISVMIQLTFDNPMYGEGLGQPQYIVVQRVVSVMNQSGPME